MIDQTKQLSTAFALLTAATLALQAQAPAVLQAKASSSLTISNAKGVETVEILNTTFELTPSQIPGRPQAERLVLRTAVRTKLVSDEMDKEATTTIEAWPSNQDLKQKPLYTISVSGDEMRTRDGALIEISRGLEEVEWFSIYKLGDGRHLLDTYLPLLRFSTSREVQTLRYVGVEVPPDDTKDARLKNARVVAVVTYISGERVIREALITADDANQAAALRSFADAARVLTLEDENATPPVLKLSFVHAYPAAAAPISVFVPIVRDDLDLAHARLPKGLHIAAWRR